MMSVSEMPFARGMRAFDLTKSNQVVIWAQSMGTPDSFADGQHRDRLCDRSSLPQGRRPTVVEAPPKMLGFLQDGLQRYLSDIGSRVCRLRMSRSIVIATGSLAGNVSISASSSNSSKCLASVVSSSEEKSTALGDEIGFLSVGSLVTVDLL